MQKKKLYNAMLKTQMKQNQTRKKVKQTKNINSTPISNNSRTTKGTDNQNN